MDKNIIDYFQVEGTFAGSYSLSIVNREFARGLKENGKKVSILNLVDNDYFRLDDEFIKNNPDLAVNIGASRELSTNFVASRNHYPPDVLDMAGKINVVHCYGWEETLYPAEWVRQFNKKLSVIFVTSDFVKKALIDSGVRIPVVVTGDGVDHWQKIKAVPYNLQAREYRFIHISSCFPRKGPDVLLEAFGKAFTKKDPVTLIIKTFPNIHNETPKQLDKFRKDNPDFPDVQIIDEEISEGCLKGLMEECQCLVAPSRGEGFGLPLAEAMLSGLVVITTDWSGQKMFCNAGNSILVGYRMAYAKSHFNLRDSLWAEPDVDDLAKAMRTALNLTTVKLADMRTKAIKSLERFTWKKVAAQVCGYLQNSLGCKQYEKPVVGVMTTWNTRCGLAAYTEHLTRFFPKSTWILAPYGQEKITQDGERVLRDWKISFDETFENFSNDIREKGINILLLQLQLYMAELDNFGKVLRELGEAGRVLTICVHNTNLIFDNKDKTKYYTDFLQIFDRIFVHTLHDMENLRKLGLIDKTTLIPHGLVKFPVYEKSPKKFLISTYGFIFPHKGLLQILEAVKLLKSKYPDLRLQMVNAVYPQEHCRKLHDTIQEYIKNNNMDEYVKLISEFLTDEESVKLLQKSSLIVFPYQNSSESSSAAVRMGISASRPVAVTPIDIFEDVKNVAHILPGTSVQDIAKGIDEFFACNDFENYLQNERTSILRDHSFSKIAGRLYSILIGLYTNKQ